MSTIHSVCGFVYLDWCLEISRVLAADSFERHGVHEFIICLNVMHFLNRTTNSESDFNWKLICMYEHISNNNVLEPKYFLSLSDATHPSCPMYLACCEVTIKVIRHMKLHILYLAFPLNTPYINKYRYHS